MASAEEAPAAWRTAGHGAATLAAVLLLVVLVPVGRRDGDAAVAREAARAPKVPDVVGLTAAKARDVLDDADLETRLRREPANDRRCRVFAQRPAAGTAVQKGADVVLRCRARIPMVVRRTPDTAEWRIEDAGFRARVLNEPGDGDRDRCRVRSQSRSGPAEPKATIRLRLTCRPKPKPLPVAAATPTESSCDPNYAGACLDPDAVDYDCEGGSGDGPEYTGPVTVVGDDHFGLDRGGTPGLACEG